MAFFLGPTIGLEFPQYQILFLFNTGKVPVFVIVLSPSPPASVCLYVITVDRRLAHSKERAMREEKITADRLAAFSDGVFAVIVTIMVLDFRAPDQSDMRCSDPPLAPEVPGSRP